MCWYRNVHEEVCSSSLSCSIKSGTVVFTITNCPRVSSISLLGAIGKTRSSLAMMISPSALCRYVIPITSCFWCLFYPGSHVYYYTYCAMGLNTTVCLLREYIDLHNNSVQFMFFPHVMSPSKDETSAKLLQLRIRFSTK